VQAGLVPISERHLAYAQKVQHRLQKAGLRVELDARNEKMNAKIRDFTLQKVPYVLVMGDKEESSEAVSVRTRGKGDQGSMPLEQFVTHSADLISRKSMDL
jgi:threonyl-tRNA synthetase